MTQECIYFLKAETLEILKISKFLCSKGSKTVFWDLCPEGCKTVFSGKWPKSTSGHNKRDLSRAIKMGKTFEVKKHFLHQQDEFLGPFRVKNGISILGNSILGVEKIDFSIFPKLPQNEF